MDEKRETFGENNNAEKDGSPVLSAHEKSQLKIKEQNERVRHNIKKQNEKVQATIKERNEKTKQTLKEQRKLIRLTASRLHKALKWSTGKLFTFSILFVAQFAVMVFSLFYLLNNWLDSNVFIIISKTLGILFAVYVVNSDIANEYKITWIALILSFTLTGIVSYIIFGRKKIPKRKLKKYYDILPDVFENCKQDDELMETAESENPFINETANLIYSGCNLPLSSAYGCEYFDIGEKYFERLKEELLTAERFIFLEFFIISKGRMWDEIFEILKEKSLGGVDVRIIYDDFGSMSDLPYKFGRKCIDANIKLYCFNRMHPFLDVAQNNRTHRKIVVIDGKCAFTGGLNIADEYINVKKRFGHWKDTGAMIRGKAVANFTLMFLSSWMVRFGKEDINKFMPEEENRKHTGNDVLCIPFSDMPANRRTICEDVYIKLIYNAKKYVYINTPYLIIDDKMSAALISAAKSGIDVRVTVPHIPDKKTAFALTRAFYSPLVAAGVKVYEYAPGFLHAKSIVSDDKYCVIGSSNMDFRSFYLHYECNIFMYKGISVKVREDYEATCEISILVKPGKRGRSSLIRRFGLSLLRLFAPLM